MFFIVCIVMYYSPFYILSVIGILKGKEIVFLKKENETPYFCP